jgi:hypothetical protein
VLARRERWPLPRRPLDTVSFVSERRLALQQVQPVTEEAPSLVVDHAIGALRHIDLGRNRAGLVEQARHVPLGDVGDGETPVVELRPTRRQAGTRCDEPRCRRADRSQRCLPSGAWSAQRSGPYQKMSVMPPKNRDNLRRAARVVSRFLAGSFRGSIASALAAVELT